MIFLLILTIFINYRHSWLMLIKFDIYDNMCYNVTDKFKYVERDVYMRNNESRENYLESILVIKNRKGYVRSIDIAHELSFTKASVSVAMKSFREQGYITVDENGNIELTDNGRKIAESVYERHKIIADVSGW